MTERPYWLAFSLVPLIGPKRVARLLQYFGSLAAAWEAGERQLHHAGLEAQPSASLLQMRVQLDLAAEMAKVEEAGAWLVTLADDAYPAPLKTVPDPPIVLYVRGTLTPADDQALGIVGTRRATNYGREAAYHIARELTGQQITIVSGLAQGIDTAAHNGALDGGGRTFAVLGSGIDRIYPAGNRPLAQKIVENGALISEFPVGTPPEARNFPRRNRVISGLALGVLVAEAPAHSGALITADFAAEQGRDVFAIPGNIFNKSSAGSNRLIQDGAKLVMEPADIMDELQIAYSAAEAQIRTRAIVPANETEARLLQHMSADPIHIDDLARLCRLPIATVSSTLTILELKGLARMVGNMQYSLKQGH